MFRVNPVDTCDMIGSRNREVCVTVRLNDSEVHAVCMDYVSLRNSWVDRYIGGGGGGLGARVCRKNLRRKRERILLMNDALF